MKEITINHPLRILIVDDHPLLRRGIISLVHEAPHLRICAEAEDSLTALQALRETKPDMAIVDISIPGKNGIELTKQMLAEVPHLLVLVVSVHHESVYALRALKAGAKGYMMKTETIHHLLDAINKIQAGNIFLSPVFHKNLIFHAIESNSNGMSTPVDQLSDRQLEILHMIGSGKSSRQMAEQLKLSIKTIETHRTHIKQKLKFDQNTEMVQFAKDWVHHEESDALV